MAAIKLKVGDRVRLYRKDRTSVWPIGTEGVVVDIVGKWVGIEDSSGRYQVIYQTHLAHA